MAEMLIVNPEKRPSKRRAAPKKKAAPARAATPPSPKKPSRARRALAAVAGKVRRFKRNPSPRLAGLAGLVKPALHGAVGAVAVNTAINHLPLPTALKSGLGLTLTQAAGAVALGAIVPKLIKGDAGKNMAVGAMTVALVNVIKAAGDKFAPSMRLGEVADVTAYPMGNVWEGEVINGLEGIEDGELIEDQPSLPAIAVDTGTTYDFA